MSMFSAFFQLSFAVPLVLKVAYLHFQGGFKGMCEGYAIYLAILGLASFLVWPDEGFDCRIADNMDSGIHQLYSGCSSFRRTPNLFLFVDNAHDYQNLESQVSRQDEIVIESTPANAGKWTIDMVSTLPELVKSTSFIAFCIWCTIMIFWLNTFIGIVNDEVSEIVADSSEYDDIFNELLLIGLIANPLFGALSDLYGYSISSFVCTGTMIIFASLYLAPTVPSMVASFALYALARNATFPLLYGYAAHDFGGEFYGQLTGLLNLIVSLFSLLQYPMVRGFGNDLKSLNRLMFFTLLPLLAFPLYLYRRRLPTPASAHEHTPPTANASDEHDESKLGSF